jgi:tol-pal system protein YbgF
VIARHSERPFRSAPLAGALLLAASAFTGCVTGSDIEGLHRHVGDVEKSVDRVAKQTSSKEEVDKLNQNLTKQVSTILRSNADMGTRFDELTRELQTLAGKLEDANRRLAQLSQQIAEAQARMDPAGSPALAGPGSVPAAGAPGPSAVAPAPVPVVPSPASASKPPAGRAAPADIYNQALGDYQRGRFDLARQGFEEYVETYPKTDLSDDALFWAAECWSAQKNPREALGTLEKLLKTYPQSDKASSAHLRKGLAHLELGEKAQAIVQLQFVVHEYPTSDEAKSARQRLRALGSDSR